MNISRSSNPVLNKETFKISGYTGTESSVMTINGTVNKIFLMTLLVVLGAAYTWNLMIQGNMGAVGIYMIGGGIGGFILALVTIFKKTWSPFTAPVYSVFQGLLLGGISAQLNQAYPGIVLQAVTLTFGTLFALLFAYRSGFIKVTENFKLGVVAATGGVFVAYMLSFLLRLFGVDIGFMHSNGPIGIIISLVVIVIASLNLVMDFDFIENGAEMGAPKYMEWYGAFGLMVTLIWLYIEFLRLLSKMSSRR